MQGVAGGLRAELAIVLQAPIPERIATLMRKLDGDPDRALRRAAGEGRTRDN